MPCGKERGADLQNGTKSLCQPKEAPMPVLPATAGVGHVHFKVADLDRAIVFYSGILGIGVWQRLGVLSRRWWKFEGGVISG